MTTGTSWPRQDAADALAAAVPTRRLDGEPSGLMLAVNAVPLSQWDGQIGRFEEVCQEQLVAFAASRWPTLSLEPRLFAIDGRPVGGALMMIRRLPIGVGSVAVCKWGPMLADARTPDTARVRRAMVDAIVAEYAERRGMFVTILPRASAVGPNETERVLAKRGFLAGSNVGFPARYIVDLSREDADHRAALGQKWRYHLGRSEKEGLSFEEADPERFPEFAALYEAMSERKRFPDYSAFVTVPDLMRIPDAALRPALFLVRQAGEAVAGAVIFRAGDTACYLYGATDDRALRLRAGYFMHWEIIRWLKRETAARWYDLGGSDGFSGLHQFKKGLVGAAGSIPDLSPMACYASRRLTFAVGSGALAVRESVQRVKTRVGLLRGRLAQPDLTPE